MRVQYTRDLEELGIALSSHLVEVAAAAAVVVQVGDIIRVDGEPREVTGLQIAASPEPHGLAEWEIGTRITHRSLREASQADVNVLLKPWEPGPNTPRVASVKPPEARVGAIPGFGYLQITDPGPGARAVRGSFEPADDRSRRLLGRFLDGKRRIEFVGTIQKCDGPMRKARMDVILTKVPASGPVELRGVGGVRPLH